MAGLYAQEPLFVVTFWWGGIGFGLNPNSIYVKYCTSYAYRELTSEEFPIDGGFAYGFLKSVSGFNTDIQIDGFGQVNQLSAEFIDYFGHFRYWMASRNVYHEIMVEVGLFFRNPNSTPDNPQKGTIYKVFEGKVRDPVVWNEADRTFKCDFVSETKFKNIGYDPSIENIMLQRFVPDPPIYNDIGQQVNEGAGEYKPYYDTERLLLQQNINTETWPQLFGRSTEIAMRPVARTPEFTVESDVPCQYGYGRAFKDLVRPIFIEYEDDLTIFENAALVIPLDENNDFFMTIQRDYVDYQYPDLPPGWHQDKFPDEGVPVVLNNYQSMDQTLGPRLMTVDIETDGEVLRCVGYLIDKFFVIPELQYFNRPLYTNIPCMKAHQSYENPDYLLWQDYNSPAATGQLKPDQKAFAAGPMPPQWVERPDYEPNMLRMPCMRVVTNTIIPAGSNVLNYDQYYPAEPEDINWQVQIGWYFNYAGNIYVVSRAPVIGGHDLEFEPALPSDLTIQDGTHLFLCPPDTPWVQGQYISFNLSRKEPIYGEEQARHPDTDAPLYLDAISGNLTTEMRDRFGNLNTIYFEIAGYTNKQRVLYARVARQVGADIHLENMITSESIPANGWLAAPAAEVTTISVVTGNLQLLPQSMDFRVKDDIQAQKNPNQIEQQRRRRYLLSQANTPYSQFLYNQITPYYLIKANSKMRVVDWWASHTYVVTTDIGQTFESVYPETLLQLYYYQVYIENVWARVNGRPVPLLGPKSGQAGETRPWADQYRRSDYFEIRRELFFIPTHRDPGDMHEYYDGVYYPTRNSTLLEWPNHVSITLYPTSFVMMLQALAANTQQVSLEAAAFNTLNSDQKIFKAVLENHTPYFYSDLTDIITSTGYPYDPQSLAFEHQAMGVLTESMDVREFLAKLAWENAKHIQIRGQYAAMVDFFKAYNPMLVFNADNIDAKSISLEYTSFDQLVTQYNVRLTNGSLWVMKGKDPFGPFDYATIKDTSIGYDLESWQKKDVDVMLNQTFRPDDFNLDLPLFDGYVKLSNLYPQFLAAQKPDPLSRWPVDPPEWVERVPLWPVEWCERSICQVLNWWLHYESRVWTVMTFRTYVDEGNRSFYLRAGDIVQIDLDGPTVKLFEDEQPPATPGGPALSSGYPMERIDGVATDFDHERIKYYSYKEGEVSGRALVLSTRLDPEEWLITVKVLLPVTAEGTF